MSQLLQKLQELSHCVIIEREKRGGQPMKDINKIKQSIFSLFVIAFFILPILNKPTQDQSAASPIYNSVESSQVVFAEEEDSYNSLVDELVRETNYFQPQWNHNVMNIGEAWEDGYTGAGIRIAILDTGFYNHPDLSMAGGNSVFADDPWSNDHSGHGTHIAGIIGAHSGTTYQGIAPGAELYGIKIYHENDIDEEGYVSTNTQSVATGIQLAMDLDVHIIVISSGLTFHDEDLYSQIQSAHNEEIMIIAASGNGNNSVNYPAVYKEVIAVTALDERLFPARDIIYGQENEFAAPGVNIGGLSIPDSAYSYPYIYMSGSSQAAPHIAGLAAIFMEKHEVRGEEARRLMQDLAVNIGDPNLYGHGLLRYTSGEDSISEEDEEDAEEEDNLASELTSSNTNGENEEEDQPVKKPTSSRAPEKEEEEPTAYYQIGAILTETGSVIPEGTLSMVESGGTIEIALNGSRSLLLTNYQISDIRERNITLILAHEKVSWTIPPANLQPGQAILRFYEGVPTGIQIQSGNVFPVYTTAIYQEDIRHNAYPGWMNIRYRMTDEEIETSNTLQGYYWNRNDEEWVETISIFEEEYIVLQTRHTSAIGIFDKATLLEAPEEKVPPDEEVDPIDEDPLDLDFVKIVGIAGVTLLLVAIAFILRKRHKKRKRK